RAEAVVAPRHGAASPREGSEEARHGDRGGRPHPPVARAAAPEPAQPRPRRRDLRPSPELPRDRARQSQPGDGAPPRARTGGPPARPQRAPPRRGLRPRLSRAWARRAGDGPGPPRPRVHPAPAGALSRPRGGRPLEHSHEQRGIEPAHGTLPRSGGGGGARAAQRLAPLLPSARDAPLHRELAGHGGGSHPVAPSRHAPGPSGGGAAPPRAALLSRPAPGLAPPPRPPPPPPPP